MNENIAFASSEAINRGRMPAFTKAPLAHTGIAQPRVIELKNNPTKVNIKYQWFSPPANGPDLACKD